MEYNAQHAETTATTREGQSSNPSGTPFNVVVSIPESIEIKMVDASMLSDYEVWFFISSMLVSAVTGFLVAFVQALDSKSAIATSLGYMALVLGLLLVVSLITTFVKRSKLQKKGKSISLKTSVP